MSVTHSAHVGPFRLATRITLTLILLLVLLTAAPPIMSADDAPPATSWNAAATSTHSAPDEPAIKVAPPVGSLPQIVLRSIVVVPYDFTSVQVPAGTWIVSLSALALASWIAARSVHAPPAGEREREARRRETHRYSPQCGKRARSQSAQSSIAGTRCPSR